MMMMMMIMMMKMTQMKLVNSRTKFRPEINNFSQPNSGGPQFQKRARGYIYTCIYTYGCIHLRVHRGCARMPAETSTYIPISVYVFFTCVLQLDTLCSG